LKKKPRPTTRPAPCGFLNFGPVPAIKTEKSTRGGSVWVGSVFAGPPHP
jgi:hypothetical protein